MRSLSQPGGVPGRNQKGPHSRDPYRQKFVGYEIPPPATGTLQLSTVFEDSVESRYPLAKAPPLRDDSKTDLRRRARRAVRRRRSPGIVRTSHRLRGGYFSSRRCQRTSTIRMSPPARPAGGSSRSSDRCPRSTTGRERASTSALPARRSSPSRRWTRYDPGVLAPPIPALTVPAGSGS